MAVSPLSRYRADIAEAARARRRDRTHPRPGAEGPHRSPGSGVTATNEPKRVECGAPDYIVARNTGTARSLGYIEAKDVGTPLDEIEKSEQLKRYRKLCRT